MNGVVLVDCDIKGGSIQDGPMAQSEGAKYTFDKAPVSPKNNSITRISSVEKGEMSIDLRAEHNRGRRTKNGRVSRNLDYEISKVIFCGMLKYRIESKKRLKEDCSALGLCTT